MPYCVASDMTENPNNEKGSTETKREIRRARFVRVAERRTRLVIEKLRVLGNCSNKGVYEFNSTDVDRIFSALQRELEQARRRFDERMKRRAEFKLEP